MSVGSLLAQFEEEILRNIVVFIGAEIQGVFSTSEKDDIHAIFKYVPRLHWSLTSTLLKRISTESCLNAALRSVVPKIELESSVEYVTSSSFTLPPLDFRGHASIVHDANLSVAAVALYLAAARVYLRTHMSSSGQPSAIIANALDSLSNLAVPRLAALCSLAERTIFKSLVALRVVPDTFVAFGVHKAVRSAMESSVQQLAKSLRSDPVVAALAVQLADGLSASLLGCVSSIPSAFPPPRIAATLVADCLKRSLDTPSGRAQSLDSYVAAFSDSVSASLVSVATSAAALVSAAPWRRPVAVTQSHVTPGDSSIAAPEGTLADVALRALASTTTLYQAFAKSLFSSLPAAAFAKAADSVINTINGFRFVLQSILSDPSTPPVAPLVFSEQLRGTFASAQRSLRDITAQFCAEATAQIVKPYKDLVATLGITGIVNGGAAGVVAALGLLHQALAQMTTAAATSCCTRFCAYLNTASHTVSTSELADNLIAICASEFAGLSAKVLQTILTHITDFAVLSLCSFLLDPPQDVGAASLEMRAVCESIDNALTLHEMSLDINIRRCYKELAVLRRLILPQALGTLVYQHLHGPFGHIIASTNDLIELHCSVADALVENAVSATLAEQLVVEKSPSPTAVLDVTQGTLPASAQSSRSSLSKDSTSSLPLVAPKHSSGSRASSLHQGSSFHATESPFYTIAVDKPHETQGRFGQYRKGSLFAPNVATIAKEVLQPIMNVPASARDLLLQVLPKQQYLTKLYEAAEQASHQKPPSKVFHPSADLLPELQSWLPDGMSDGTNRQRDDEITAQALAAAMEVLSHSKPVVELERHAYQGVSTSGGVLTQSKRGTHVFANRDVYDGDWKAGLMHGEGTYTYAVSGNQYRGSFVANVKHGYGIFVYSSTGAQYSGEWQNGSKSGTGTLTDAQGTSYEGEWFENQMHGTGKYHSPQGDLYEGTFLNGRRSGRGTRKYANGDFYDGAWLDDVEHGAGYMKYANGSEYHGFFECGKRHGPGRLTTVDGAIMDGMWDAGDLHNLGTMHFPNGGPVYSGGWRAGQMHGTGIYTYPGGRSYHVEYADGVCIRRSETAIQDLPAVKIALPPVTLLGRDAPHAGIAKAI